MQKVVLNTGVHSNVDNFDVPATPSAFRNLEISGQIPSNTTHLFVDIPNGNLANAGGDTITTIILLVILLGFFILTIKDNSWLSNNIKLYLNLTNKRIMASQSDQDTKNASHYLSQTKQYLLELSCSKTMII